MFKMQGVHACDVSAPERAVNQHPHNAAGSASNPLATQHRSSPASQPHGQPDFGAATVCNLLWLLACPFPLRCVGKVLGTGATASLRCWSNSQPWVQGFRV